MSINTLQPTIILNLTYGEGVAFEGKNAAEFLKLLSSGIPVQQTYKHGRYGWYNADPDADIAPKIEFLSRSIEQGDASTQINARLKEAEDKLQKHADMIAAAEALEGGNDES
jgi:hypothetical protein